MRRGRWTPAVLGAALVIASVGQEAKAHSPRPDSRTVEGPVAGLEGGQTPPLPGSSDLQATAVESHDTGLHYFTVPPCRLLNTQSGAPISAPLTVTVAGVCGVPAGAASVAGNFTVVAPAAYGFAVLTPTATPTGTSTINYRPGVTRANSFVMSLASGQLRISSSYYPIHAIIDVTGYVATSGFPHDWTTMSIGGGAQWDVDGVPDGIYSWWRRDGSSQYIDDVVHLANAPANGRPDGPFRNQILANPKVVYNDAGEWLIMGYGDNNLDDTAVCDAIYVLKRKHSGEIVLPTNPVLAYPAPPPVPPPTPCQGGYLGNGAAFTKTPTATSLGYRYFAILPAGNPQLGQAWVTWAVSQDEEGQIWRFVAEQGGTTTDPRQSVKLIRKSDLSYHYEHLTMVYNVYDNFFYVVLGYNGACGIKGTWWRIRFDPSNSWGLPYNPSLGSYEVQRLSSAGSAYVISNGVIPEDFDNWQCAAQSPPGVLGPADPMDLVQLYKSNGTFDSMLFVYVPEQGYGPPTDVYWVKGGLPCAGQLPCTQNFTWGTPTALNTSTLQPRYSYYGAGGGYYLAVNQSGWDTLGRPNLFGWLATWRTDLHAPVLCGPDPSACQPTGFLPIHLNLN